MNIINPITVAIVREAKNGDSIRQIAKKTGFAYSAVYRWVTVLIYYGVLTVDKKGNKNKVFVNKNPLYLKFIELSQYIDVVEKDMSFWNLMKKTKLGVRFVTDTTAVIWTHGGYITGDFYDKIYHVEVLDKDFETFGHLLKKHNIGFGEDVKGPDRPFVCIKPKKKFKVEKKNGLPVMPLSELVSWCKRLELEPVLEQLDILYGLDLKVKYSEILTNV